MSVLPSTADLLKLPSGPERVALIKERIRESCRRNRLREASALLMILSETEPEPQPDPSIPEPAHEPPADVWQPPYQRWVPRPKRQAEPKPEPQTLTSPPRKFGPEFYGPSLYVEPFASLPVAPNGLKACPAVQTEPKQSADIIPQKPRSLATRLRLAKGFYKPHPRPVAQVNAEPDELSDDDRTSGPYIPSPEEIAAACAEIRSGWSSREHHVRAGMIPSFGDIGEDYRPHHPRQHWTVPQVSRSAVRS